MDTITYVATGKRELGITNAHIDVFWTFQNNACMNAAVPVGVQKAPTGTCTGSVPTLHPTNIAPPGRGGRPEHDSGMLSKAAWRPWSRTP